jgi:hypothetical protein
LDHCQNPVKTHSYNCVFWFLVFNFHQQR